MNKYKIDRVTVFILTYFLTDIQNHTENFSLLFKAVVISAFVGTFFLSSQGDHRAEMERIDNENTKTL